MTPQPSENDDGVQNDKSLPLVEDQAASETRPHEEQDEEVKKTCCERTRDWFGSVFFFVYFSHILSTWGDGMWHFAVGLFLVYLTENSLQLTAIYGFSSGGCVLLFGALIGDWVDRNPRLKVARTSLVIQNLSVILCAVVICLMVYYPVAMVTVWDGWLNIFCQILVIVFADIAVLASTGHKIAIERDWVVEICNRDKKTMTRMTAVLRRINLTTNILAPVGVGQIFTFGSFFIGAAFIASWNVMSFFVEYYLLQKVYYAVPALASKKKRSRVTEGENVEDGEVEPCMTEPEIKVSRPSKRCPDVCLKIFGTFITLYKGWRCYMNQSVRFAGLALACLYMTVLGFDNITTGYAYSQGMSEAVLGVMMALGAIAGILGTYGFQHCRGKFGLERTGLYSLCNMVACLTLCVASIWAPGSPFDPFPKVQNTMNLNCSISNVNTSTDATAHPNVTDSAGFTQVNLQTLLQNSTGVNDTLSRGELESGPSLPDVRNSSEKCRDSTSVERNYFSLVILMTGIIAARFGLWSSDLTITQLILETVVETERGTVNGVQSSLNMLMDMIKFALVIVAPDPHTFGILILLSFSFIVLGLILYAVYCSKGEGHLPQIKKCCGGKRASDMDLQTTEQGTG